MLDPAWASTPVILWVALVGLLALLVVRTVRRDRREYQRFKRYRTTARRQRMMRRWLLDSFLSFGVLSVLLLLLAGRYVAPLAQELTTWPGVRDIRGWFIHAPGTSWGVVVGLAVGFTIVTVFGLRAARTEAGVPMIGDIAAMLPRNRQELAIGAAMSVNAGVVEELMFRLALPAVIFGATGSAIAAVAGSVLFFGALHLYQGVSGIIGTTVIGAIFMLAYAVSGTILLPIVLHALFDLRSLVLIPMAVYRVHLVDARASRIIAPRLMAPSMVVPVTSSPVVSSQVASSPAASSPVASSPAASLPAPSLPAPSSPQQQKDSAV